MADEDGFVAALGRVNAACERGFTSGDPAGYAEIASALEPHAARDGVDAMLRLCEAGPTLTSKRFAYPHIQERALDMLAARQAG